MPVVDVAHRVGLGADDAWKAVADFEAFPRIAASIRNVEILDERGPIRDSRWTVFFEDLELEWQEEDVIDEKERRIDFRLVDGDLAHLDGYWQVFENGTGARGVLPRRDGRGHVGLRGRGRRRRGPGGRLPARPADRRRTRRRPSLCRSRR